MKTKNNQYRIQLEQLQIESLSLLGALVQNSVTDENLITQTQFRKQRIEAAIERLNEGAFGSCLNCQQTIQPSRLELLPYAELCLSCQRLAEVKGDN